MKEKKKTLFLDFDGVICENTEECYISSLNAFNALFDKKAVKKYDLKGIPKKEIELYSKLRSYQRTGKDNIIMMLIIKKNPTKKIDSTLEFDKYANKHIADFKKFQSAFYNARAVFVKKKMNDWLKLNTVHKEFKAGFSRMTSKYDVFIVSKKDKPSIIRIFKRNKINLNSKKIIGNENTQEKVEIIKKIMKEKKQPLSNAIFVDDGFEHVIKARNQEIECVLAGWGYNSQKQRKIAKEKRITCMTLNQFNMKIIKKIE